MLSVSVNSYEQISYCVWKTLVPWYHPSTLVLKFFLPTLLHSSQNPEKRGLIKTYHLGLSVTKSLTPHILYNLWVCMFDLPVLLDVLRNLHALGIKGSYTVLPKTKQNKTPQIPCNTRNKDTGRYTLRTLAPLTIRRDR